MCGSSALAETRLRRREEIKSVLRKQLAEIKIRDKLLGRASESRRALEDRLEGELAAERERLEDRLEGELAAERERLAEGLAAERAIWQSENLAVMEGVKSQ